jgi:hypothetical protein
MSRIFDHLVGQKIQNAVVVYDYIQIFFGNGAVLNVFNTFVLAGFEYDAVSQLIGCEVSAVNESETEVKFAFLDNKSLSINLRDSAYKGPEAMEFFREDGECIVWN